MSRYRVKRLFLHQGDVLVLRGYHARVLSAYATMEGVLVWFTSTTSETERQFMLNQLHPSSELDPMTLTGAISLGSTKDFTWALLPTPGGGAPPTYTKEYEE